MALKALLLKKQIDNKRKALDALRAKAAEFETREADLAKAIEEVENDERRNAVQELVDAFEADRQQHDADVAALEQEITGLESDLAAEEAAQDTTPPPADNPAPPVDTTQTNEERNVKAMPVTEHTGLRARIRARLDEIATRDAAAKQTLEAYAGEVRTAIKEKRALTNVGLTIPQVMLGLLRENIENYSKLYRHVTVRQINGEGRMVIMGTIPEAIWTDCCANLNELSLGFNDMELDCYRVAGFFAICNANLEDSDLDLIAEVITALGQAIGLALDKAILYGRNSNDAMKMPQGVVSSLVQTAAPSGYPATARPWVDLHTSNVIAIGTAQTPLSGAELIAAIVTASGAMKGKYSRGEKVWVMNESTYTALMAATVSVDAAGRIVTGVTDTMPVVGGIIEVLSFIPDGTIIGGYFDLYVLAERAGARFASSEHVRFLADQTVVKGVARYDGAPAIREAFIALGINGVAPVATGVTFPADTANAED